MSEAKPIKVTVEGPSVSAEITWDQVRAFLRGQGWEMREAESYITHEMWVSMETPGCPVFLDRTDTNRGWLRCIAHYAKIHPSEALRRIAGTCSSDQPPPRPSTGPAVWPLIIGELAAAHGQHHRIVRDATERHNIGIARYGTSLHIHNGRDALLDAYQEALDMMAYTRQLAEEDPSDRSRKGLYCAAVNMAMMICDDIIERERVAQKSIDEG